MFPALVIRDSVPFCNTLRFFLSASVDLCKRSFHRNVELNSLCFWLKVLFVRNSNAAPRGLLAAKVLLIHALWLQNYLQIFKKAFGCAFRSLTSNLYGTCCRYAVAYGEAARYVFAKRSLTE